MTIRMRQPFTPGGKFVVSKPFRFAGKDYKVGDEFPWRQLSCSVRRLRSLYEGRNLNNNYIDDEERALEELAVVDANTGGGGGGIESPLAIFDPEIHEIVNPEKGKWFIDLDGAHVMRVTGREAKRLRKVTEATGIDETTIREMIDVEEVDE